MKEGDGILALLFPNVTVGPTPRGLAVFTTGDSLEGADSDPNIALI